ncbi:hypothetical protein CAFE_27120 [Caprobacter fermentans]|uniref:Uncharacterized protein n=1 Tax=Caproicibacter fermentans TaxID=2576756 RepID=A0A6N8I392_9FIRM|nr:SprT-like domain-containing protein [Caproicibacter fermentans]MVB11983.1 hypothetical protein [Caproicibacter fermentans]
MELPTKTSRAAGFLELAYQVLNNRYFEGRLNEPIITIQKTKCAYGHVTVGKVWRSGAEHRHELNIGAGTLDRPIANVIATLLHEMVHLWNIQEGIQDCSRSGYYHNKRFRDAANCRDLEIGFSKNIGWSITQPAPALCAFIEEQGWREIDMNRDEVGAREKGGADAANVPNGMAHRPSSTRKYVCPACHTSVRATHEVRVRCEDCNEMMVLAK